MLKSTLYAILGAFGFAMLLFVTGFAGWHLGMAWLTATLYPVAIKIILLASAVMLLVQTGLMLQALYRGLSLYFRRETMAMRRVLMLKILQHDARQRLLLEKRQMRYLTQLKRQRLLADNDKKQSGELYKAISAELQSCMTPESYKTLRNDLKRHHKQSNPQAMLALRDQVLCRS